MAGEMDSVLAEFVNESREHLAGIETDLLTIEEGGADVDVALVNKVFRAAHSIKGGSAFFGFQKVKQLAHKAETVLDMLRSKRMTPNAEVTNILLCAFDKLREMINDTGTSEGTDIADLLVNLTGLASSWLPPEQKASLHTQVKLTTPAGDTVELLQADLDRVTRTGKFVYLVDCDLIHDIEKKGVNILTLFHKLTSAGEIVDCVVDFDAVGTLDDPVGNRVPLRLVIATVLDPDMVGGLFETIPQERIHMLSNPRRKTNQPQSVSIPSPSPESASSPPDAVVDVPVPVEVALAPIAESVSEPEPQHTPVPSEKSAAHAPSVTVEETLRVNVGLLENLMNLAGELVLSRNQLRAAVAGENRTLLSSADQRINQVTAELQDVIMQTRLQPIGNIFAKFPRVVRDLAQSMGKEIELDIRGKDVALDKTLIEGLSDPLTHMVRNAVDHGVESPEERRRAGKKPAGTVRIEARHDAGMVMVEIADNGKGIDGNKVAAAAVRKGLIAEEKLQGLTERDKQALVFLPGLSTAATVSDVSGRGVGMDVVKSNLDRLGGQVEISSVVGKGSTFSIKLPLTLAIMPSLIVSVGNERFAIPQTNIEELLRLRPDEIKERIRIAGDAETLLLRDRILPLVRFDQMVARQEEVEEAETDGSAALEIAVVTTGLMSYGLVVGAFHETEEVVVKPLGRRLKTLREYSGATILGDGTVALILDVAGVASGAEFSDVADSARAAELDAQIEAQRLEDTHSLLLFYNRPDEPCAVPLDLVQRIERIRPEQIEQLGRHRTMKFRGGSLPLMALGDAATVGTLDGVDDLVVLVSKVSDHEVGLLGAMPVDVIETKAKVDEETHRQKGIAGSSILRDRTTLIVDVFEVVDAVHPEWRATKKQLRASESAPSAPCNPETLINLDQVEDPVRQPRGAGTILLAEDSDFFRNQVKRYLEDDGFTVLAAPDGEAAWDLLVRNLDKVRLVVTDIEMPRLDGLGFTRRIRGDKRTDDLPVIAVTSLASEEDEQRGREAGVNQYHVKLDRDKLVDSVHRMMQSKEK